MGMPLHVMAGVLLDAGGRVLLAQRPPGKQLAGAWEFPGGKLEPGETPRDALARELCEELGVALREAGPLIRVPWRHESRELLLDAWTVRAWDGEPAPLDGQALRWRLPDEIDPAALAPADRPILQALRLPPHYPITPSDLEPSLEVEALACLRRAILGGARMLQLRLPRWPLARVRELAAELLPMAQEYGARLLLNADIEGARRLGIGVHLKAAQLRELDARPLPWRQPVGASCHDEAGLALAARLGADFATLSPVAATASHPGQPPLGWERFRAAAEAAALPVYALGGMVPADAARARDMAGQGVAGIRGFWAD